MNRTLALLCLLTACGGASALRRGQKLEAAGNWNGAYLAYSEAVAANPKKPNPEAVEAKERAADILVEQDATAGREALAADDYEGAMGAVERISDIDPDRPEAFQLKLAIESKMSAAYLRLWSAGQVPEAYAFAVRIQKLFPDAKILGGAFHQLREAVVKKAEQLLAKGQHAEALATIRVISTHEPDQKALVAPIEQKIISAWADALAQEAKRMQSAKKTGAASLLYARAFEVGARAPDIDRARAIAAELAPLGRLRVKLEVTGPQARASSMRALLTGGLSVLPDVTVVTTGTSDLVVRAALGPTKCTETDSPSNAVAAVGGSADEADADAEEAQAAAEEEAAEDEATQEANALAAAEETLGAVEAKLDSADAAAEEAEAALDETVAQRDAAQGRLDELEATLDEQRDDAATPATLAETERQIAEVEVRVAAYEDQVRSQEDALETADALVATLEADLAAAEAEVERLGGGGGTEEPAKRASKKEDKSAEKTSEEPSDTGADETEDENADSSDYVRYELHTWTRGCTAPATVSLRPAWKTDLGPARELAPRAETVDKAHGAQPEVGLAENPKAYAMSDADLVAKGDATTAAEVSTWVTTAADTYFRDRATLAMTAAKTDPKGASTSIVSLYVGSPNRVDAATAEMFATHARDVYGLTSLELVRPTPPPVAAAPAAEDAEEQDD